MMTQRVQGCNLAITGWEQHARLGALKGAFRGRAFGVRWSDSIRWE